MKIKQTNGTKIEIPGLSKSDPDWLAKAAASPLVDEETRAAMQVTLCANRLNYEFANSIDEDGNIDHPMHDAISGTDREQDALDYESEIGTYGEDSDD